MKTSIQYAFVYSGPHYGRRHRVLAHSNGPTRTITVEHVPSGDILTVPACDIETISSESQPLAA